MVEVIFLKKRGKCYRGLDLPPDFLAGNETTTAAITTTASTNTNSNETTIATAITTVNTHTDEILDLVLNEDSNCNNFVLDEDSNHNDF